MSSNARRVIAHLDIDAFYASVELRRRPELRGLPVIVAGSGPRAVVTTASYEARRFGVDSAMPAARARALCPDAVVIAPDFEAYRRTSGEVWSLVASEVAVIQSAGIDEAYLELSEEPFPVALLRGLVATVRERTGMTLSVGIGPSRLVAKTASAHFKPAAFVAMSREQAVAHFAAHPPRLLQGIGPKTAERLAALGIQDRRASCRRPAGAAVAALRRAHGRRAARARALLRRQPGRAGPDRQVALERGHLPRPTSPTPRRWSTRWSAWPSELGEGLRARRRRARTIAIKVRLDDWTTVTRARTIERFTDDSQTIAAISLELLRAYAPVAPGALARRAGRVLRGRG
jgi:DNA polymerase-4